MFGVPTCAYEEPEGRTCAEVDDRLRIVLHEIRQPVAAVLALAEAARGLPGADGELSSYLDRIINQVQEVSSAAWSVLDAPEIGDPLRWATVDLTEVLDSVQDAFAATWPGTLVSRVDRRLVTTQGDRATLRRILVNVLENAVRAAGPTGTVLIDTVCGPAEVRIVVEDDGPGFGHVPRRTGIGLRVIRQALAAHGGTLALGRSRELRGGRVELRLPLRVPVIPRPRRPLSGAEAGRTR
jgi:signal transduction histidine kinase